MPSAVRSLSMLARLESEISREKDSVTRDCKKLERAAYLARMGSLAEAISTVTEVREIYVSNPNAKISSWTHLADGLIDHFTNLSCSSRQKILRAYALSSAASLVETRSICAAWLAHLEYASSNFESMIKYANEALDLSLKFNNAAATRSALIVALAYHFAGGTESASPWYRFVRLVATMQGDEATISALIHNMAWLRAQSRRAESCGLPIGSVRLEDQTLLAAESSENYDILVGSKSLPVFSPILKAQILIVDKEYYKALTIYSNNIKIATDDVMRDSTPDLLADQAWGMINVGLIFEASEKVTQAVQKMHIQSDDKISLFAQARVAQVFEALGNIDDARKHKNLALEGWAKHLVVRTKLLRLLDDEFLPYKTHITNFGSQPSWQA
jgi:tetratricopeptide (TPR) repeat protein